VRLGLCLCISKGGLLEGEDIEREDVVKVWPSQECPSRYNQPNIFGDVMRRKIRVFLAGIILGSDAGKGVHPQAYRARIRELLAKYLPEAEVYDPVEHYPGSVEYPYEYGRRVFFSLMKRAAETDMVLAFLPEASLGTAIEVWEAHKAGVFVAVISPMKYNWAVRFLSDVVLEDMDTFEVYIASGKLKEEIAGKKGERRK